MATRTKLIFPGLAGFYETMNPIAYTIVRVVFGWIMIMHALPKYNRGAAAVGNAFATNYGLPSAFGGIAIYLELIGGAALIIGLFTRFFAAALAIELLIAMMAAHWAKGFAVGQGGYEFVLFLGLVCFAIAIRGGGPYSVDAKLPKEL
ncbi:MAG: DoxX family protein [Pseudolabrys sp.]|nr:DoxX family protein [Pseudolabrys sp.]MBV9955630.1 DoxX family protein [Pseudolabrys sp.]